MNKGKQSIQEIILNFLSSKRAIRQKDLCKHVETNVKDFDKKQKTKPKYLINKTIKKMVSDEMIEEHETSFSSFLSLTKTGRHRLRNIRLSSESHLVSTIWDGYWRIIIVDIPESRKKERDALRYILKKAQFVQIKNSMWISPFPMENIMIEMKDDLELHEELMIFVTDKLDPETEKLLEQKFIQSKKES